MALIPFLDDYLDFSRRPSRLLDQHFGLGLDDEDLLSAFIPRRIRRSLSSPYYRPWHLTKKDSGSVVSTDKNKFEVSLDVQQFAPEEITVKSTGENTITVEGKHEEKEDEHGYVSRHFVRKYTLPKGHDISKCTSKLSSDGVLTISAPKVDHIEGKSIDIPITFTNQPSRIDNKTAANGECQERMECKTQDGKAKREDRKKN